MSLHGLYLAPRFVMNAQVPDAFSVVKDLWLVFGLYWLVSALKRKKTKQRESWVQRGWYLIPLIAAAWFLGGAQPRYSWLGQRFIPENLAVAWLGAAMTAAGIAIALWARWHLGTNWSGTVTLKEGHELIRTGPYRTIRHPIYTGILLAMIGSAVTWGQVRGLLMAAILWAAFYVKARREESFLAQEFGERFAEHVQHTGMFLPKMG
jgi:protein-S-isoprenylcysteine O-methyltransferase Ste14